MKVAFLSGKGGAGKTLLSVNLSAIDSGSVLVDCDVEEPNSHLFYHDEPKYAEKVVVKVPFIDNELCDGCRICTNFCKFNALAYVKDHVKLFEEVCHSCGGCAMLCPTGAISEVDRVIGEINHYESDEHTLLSGILNVGEATGVPIVKRLIEKTSETDANVYIDCPPGSACVTMESIKDADVCVLVTEPTIFGLHNLKMVKELAELYEKPYGIVINKFEQEDNPVEQFCQENNVLIIGKIPYSKDIARMVSDGEVPAVKMEKYTQFFKSINEEIKEVFLRERTPST